MSASSMNMHPWHFVVVRDRQVLRDLGGLVRTGPYIAGSAAAIVVAYERKSRFGVSDASRAIQGMILTAWADGVGSNWTGLAASGRFGSMSVSPTPTKSSRLCPSAIRNGPLGRERRSASRSPKWRRRNGSARLTVSVSRALAARCSSSTGLARKAARGGILDLLALILAVAAYPAPDYDLSATASACTPAPLRPGHQGWRRRPSSARSTDPLGP